jgi:hypothetical protein
LQSLGLHSTIDSREKFLSLSEKAYATALDRLRGTIQVAPGPKLLQEVHEILFGTTLGEVGEFRKMTHAPGMGNLEKHDAAGEISLLLYGAALKHQDLLSKKNHEQVAMIAAYHVNLLDVKAFPDVERGNFVNRIMAELVSEAQLEHCFGARSIKREIDAKLYEAALQSWNEDKSLGKLTYMFMKMAGSGYNVLQRDKWLDPDKDPSKDKDKDKDKDNDHEH